MPVFLQNVLPDLRNITEGFTVGGNMSDYLYHQELQRIWELAVTKYREGNRDALTYFDGPDAEFIASIGATAQEIFDFAEDFVSGGEPDFTTFAMLADIRRSYFLQQQKGKRSTHVVQDAELPPKTESVSGIVWLPRIIVKAKAKLKGEMNPNLMYGCGGDRKFFKTNNLHPAEFLRLVADHLDNDAAVIEYVAEKAKKG
jgi:hypothetical protein